MANYYASARSNYFKVKDEAAFREWAEALNLGVWEKDDMFAVFDEGPDSCGWPYTKYDEEHDEDIDVDLPAELAAHLAQGEVAVLMETGAEKLRYLIGRAVAVNWAGETVEISLGDIYKLAKDRWGVNPDRAEY